jgi:hypothetical protein
MQEEAERETCAADHESRKEQFEQEHKVTKEFSRILGRQKLAPRKMTIKKKEKQLNVQNY